LPILEQGQTEARSQAGGKATLSELSSQLNKIAVISGDGNEMGRFFASLPTIEDRALASQAVSLLFKHALDAATCDLDKGDFVAPVVGGDDIRLFVQPEGVFERMERLAQALHKGTQDLSRHWQPPPKLAEALEGIGIGIGLVIGPASYPASALIGFAHALEISAKQICGSGKARSALDFAFMRSGEELVAGGGNVMADHRLEIAGSGERPSLSQALERARRLLDLGVPSSQRALLARLLYERQQGITQAEALNQLRYQVARSLKWQSFFGESWTDARRLERALPTHAELEIARIEEQTQRAGS